MQLRSLKNLWLDQNFFEVLPSTIGELPELALLSVVDNELDDIPDEILKLRNLYQVIYSVDFLLVKQTNNIHGNSNSHNNNQ